MLRFSLARRTARRAPALAAIVLVLTVPGAAAAPVTGPQAADEQVAREHERERRAIRDQETADQRKRRRESRSAFATFSADEALQLAERLHPEFVLLPAWRAPALPLGHRITGYSGDYVARVAAPDGGGANLVVSSVPMRATSEDGVKRPVDLSLKAGRRDYRVVNPLADIRLSKRLHAGLELEASGLVVRPLVETQADPTLSGDTLFYGNALQDADILVRPEVGGFGVHLQVRSEDAPENFALDLSVPQGGTLDRAASGDGIELVRDGKVVAGISAPVAFDADGRPVEVEWDLDGRRLKIHVAHRGRDLAYPLLVDPSVVETYEWERYGTNGQYGNFEFWNYFWTGPFTNHSWAGTDPWLGAGMYIRNLGTTYSYADGHHGKWVWRAPGFGRIWQIEWNLVDQDAVQATELELGVVRHPVDESMGPTWWTGTGNPVRRSDVFRGGYFRTCSMTCLAGSGAPGDEAQFSVVARGAADRSYFAAQVGVVYLYMSDSDIPVLGADLPRDWVDWPGEKALDVWAVDSSSGISQLNLSAPGWSGAAIGPSTYTRCRRTYRCPRAHMTDGVADNALVRDMPEGVNTLSVVARDAAGSQKTAATTTVHSGNGLRGQYYSDEEFRTLAADRLDPQVDFNWGAGSPHPALPVNKSGDANSFTTRWSGYVTAPETGEYTFQTSTDDGVRLWVGDLNTPVVDDWRHHTEAQRQATVSLEAGTRYRIVMEYFESRNNAVARLRWRLPSRPASEAPVAIPSAALSPPSAWTFKLDRTPPAIQLSGSLKENENRELAPGEYKLIVDATDGSTASPAQQRSGVQMVEIFVDGEGVADPEQECPAGNCPLHQEYTFNTEQFPGGEHTILVEATDQLGHVSASSFKVRTRCCMRDAADWGTFDTAYDWRLADVNGDQRADVVGRHSANGDVRVSRSTGQSFQAAESWGNVPTGQELYVADASGDGRADLVARDTDGTIRVSLSTGTAFASPGTWGTWSTSMDVHLADVDQNPGADLVGRDDATDEVRVGLSTGVGFAPASRWQTVPDGDQVAVADVDDDDMADLVVRDPDTNAVHVGRSTQTSFDALASWGTWSHGSGLNARDLHGDAMAELWAFDPLLGNFTVSVSDGNSFLAPQGWGSLNVLHGAPRVGDVDGDAGFDVLQRTPTGTLSVRLARALGPILAESDPYTPLDDDLYDDTDEFSEVVTTEPSGQPSTRQITTCGPTGPSTAVRRASPRLVAQDDDVFLGSASGNGRTRRDWAYQRLAEAGVSIIRFNAYWGHIEADRAGANGQPQYNWSALETGISEAKCRGFDVYVTLTGAATNGLDCDTDLWPGDRTDPNVPHPYGCVNDDPADPADGGEPGYTGARRATLDYLGRSQVDAWGDFVNAAATHFAATTTRFELRVNVFGLWNEPNLPTFLRGGNAFDTAAFYRELYDEGWDRGRINNQVRLLFGELSEVNRGPVTTARFIEEVAEGAPLVTHGVAIHPYQHRARPGAREPRRFGIGRLRQLTETVRNLWADGQLRTPVSTTYPRGRIPRLYGTEFGYWNRQFKTQPINTWHTEGERRFRLRRALTLARRHRLRWFTLYQVTEKTPRAGMGATNCERPEYADQWARYEPGIWDMGLIGQAGEVEADPADLRCYGRNSTGSQPLDQAQERRAFCAVVRWGRRANKAAVAQGNPRPYAVAPGTVLCP